MVLIPPPAGSASPAEPVAAPGSDAAADATGRRADATGRRADATGRRADAAARGAIAARADALAAAPLLNCLLREVAEPEAVEPEAAEPEAVEPEVAEPVAAEPEAAEPEVVEPVAAEPEAVEPEAAEPGMAEQQVHEPEVAERQMAEPRSRRGTRQVHRLPSGRLLRVRGTRRPAEPEVRADGAWHRLDHRGLVDLVATELRHHTGLANPELPAEMLDSRDAVAALLAARARATPPEDPYLRSEQSLLTGHPHHPAPKTRGGGPPGGWLPYAPEAYARFPLVLLGLREDTVVEDGDTAALEALGEAPPGYRLLPAHPWQLDLARTALAPAFADGRLVRLGTTPFDTWPTAAVRTLYAPGPDLFLKFSLDVRITNDIRRLWRHDLLRLRRTDAAATRALAAVGGPAAWLSDRGYRTAGFAFEELAVVVRDGLHAHVTPGATPLLAAGLVEGFEGSPLAGTADPAHWWEAYLAAVVPPALAAFADHGVVLEAHLQNTLVAVDSAGRPVQALFRDAEGVKLLPGTERAAGWERLVYCLVVNHLTEVAAALADHHPGLDPWPAARRELARHDLPEVHALLAAPTLPGKTNLLLRWTGADGADARYLPLPNPLAGS